jgi:hypothetical protein
VCMADQAAAELAAIQAESAALRAELGMAEPEPTAEEGTPAMAVDPSKFTHRMGCVPAMGSIVRTPPPQHAAGPNSNLPCVRLAASMPAISQRTSWAREGEWGNVLCHEQPMSTHHFLTGVHAAGMAQLSRP